MCGATVLIRHATSIPESPMTLGHVTGVPVRLHWTFLVALPALWVWSGVRGGWAGVGWALAVTLGLFGSVLAHEIGHAWVARQRHIRTHEIVLLPIGGAARMELRFVAPIDDLLVSLAGPVVSLALGGVLLAIGGASGVQLLWLLGGLNVLLGVLNLIPALPMDGGRILRALLAHQLDDARAANRWALAVSLAFTVGLLVYAAMSNVRALGALALMFGVMQAREWRAVQALYRVEPSGAVNK